jgi:hypothetical protein
MGGHMNIEEVKQVNYRVNVSAHELLSAYSKVDDPEIRQMIFHAVQNAVTVDSNISLFFDTEESAQHISTILRDAIGQDEHEPQITMGIQSKTNPKLTYLVKFDRGIPISCTCKDFENRGEQKLMCKHMGEAIAKLAKQTISQRKEQAESDVWRSRLVDVGETEPTEPTV